MKIDPNDRLSLTPRIVYQRVETDGWNRCDAYNILANPYTTTRRAVTRGTSELPAYDILNLRAGLRRNAWDVSVYVNNVADEQALLSLDRERGTRARISYLVNQPRTFGAALRFGF